MIYADLLIELQKHDFNYEPYVYLALEDLSIRNQLVENITGDYHINIYYNSYHLIDGASKQNPTLFYCYWDQFVPLLNHKNSYHRSIAHWILTNLIPVDILNKFDSIKNKYFSMIQDEKFQTGLMALRDIITISKYKREYVSEIVQRLTEEKYLEQYKENQKIKFYCEILEYFNVLILNQYKTVDMEAFIEKRKTFNNKKVQKLAIICLENMKYN